MHKQNEPIIKPRNIVSEFITIILSKVTCQIQQY